MKEPIFRIPTRDARDADHMAIIAIAGGVYLWLGRAGLPAATLPWVTGIAVASVLCGFLLWLRVPAVKWLGVLVFAAICGLGIRRLVVTGFAFGVAVHILFGIFCAIWMARIDYSHKFFDDDAA